MSEKRAIYHVTQANQLVEKADKLATRLESSDTAARASHAVHALAALATVHLELARWEM